MVVGDKHYKHTDEGPVKNVRRNRSPPTASGSAAEDGAGASENESGMREGAEYQAVIPEFNPVGPLDAKAPSWAVLVWSPNNERLDFKVDCYIEIAREKYGYTQEQALGMLFWHRHNIDKALSDLSNFAPFPDDWNTEDKVLFEQAFSFHGKNFQRIHNMLHDKSMGSLVKYYYSWKKSRCHVSHIDKQTQKLSSQSGNGCDKDIIDDSDSDFESTKDIQLKEDGSSASQTVMRGRGKTDIHTRSRNRHKPPFGVHLNPQDLSLMAPNGPNQGQADVMMNTIISDLISLKRKVIANKQTLSSLKQKTSLGIDAFRLPENSQNINSKWTNAELLLAVQGIRQYGKDFSAVGEMIGNKTEHLVRTFFMNYRRRYNLDEVLREHEKETGKKYHEESEDGPTDMEVDGATSAVENRIGWVAASPPPPLLKQLPPVQPPSQLDNINKQIPPVLHQAIKSLPQGSRTILQQPPPLFRQGAAGGGGVVGK